jgi:pimeloyl-ACP methyl ester carboxylesterase
MSGPVSVVLVHGAFHGGWCWERVIPLLPPSVAIEAVDLPCTSLEADARHLRDVLDDAVAPVLLCGHSYGGMVITEAGGHAKVEHLVYLAAAMPRVGQGMEAAARDERGSDGRGSDGEVSVPPLLPAGDALTVDPALASVLFYADCDSVDVEAAVARLRPTAAGCLSAPATEEAWRVRPTTYVVCTEDQAIPPDVQRWMSREITDVREWSSSHSPFLSHPQLVAGLLEELAVSIDVR